MEESLNKRLAELEAENHKKDLVIAKLTGYLEGCEIGYNLAKDEVVDMLYGLPKPEMNIDSINNFFLALTKVIKNVGNMKLPK